MFPLAAFRHSGRELPSSLQWLLTLSAAALMLCTVALLNGGPIYYPDTSSCGALGGVFARYQGRLVWLLPLAATISVICVLRQPRKIGDPSIASAS